MDALVLAGGLNSGSLRKVSEAQYEAEIEVAGRPMVDYVIAALQRVPVITRIIVVCGESVLSETLKEKVTLVKPGKTLIDSLNNGLKTLNTEEPVLVLTSDIPLITKEALEDFLNRCRQREADVYYSVVPKDANERKYPGVQRTYVRLSEGTFTGGNLVLLSPRVIQNHMDVLNKAVSYRKKPLQLCLMVGWKFLYYLFTGKLTIKQIEARVAKMLKIKAAGIITPYPEVGIDVDKPSDLWLVNEVLSN